MAAFESAYESLLQGVSQQIPRMRAPGQATAQVNMLSDPVTALRRRPGASLVMTLDVPGSTSDSIKAWGTDLGGEQVQVLVCSKTGRVIVLGHDYTVKATLTSPYLVASNVRSLRAAAVQDYFFIANVEEKPTVTAATGGIPPSRRGYAYVLAGAYNKTYTVTVRTNLGTAVGTYTTPDATAAGAGHAALPENIAQSLVTAINPNLAAAGLTVQRVGPYLYFQGSTSVTRLSVSTDAGSVYMGVSGDSRVRVESELPARLPDGADGYIMSVGRSRTAVYYKYDSSRQAWLESGDFNSPTGITNMPIALRKDPVSGWMLDSSAFEGRLAGDDDTNPLPEFVNETGITGIGAYQGRLVILSGPFVCMSASRHPRRFMRSTVTALLAEDSIGVASGANSSASYEYAVPFQKDLLLFSSRYQALVPGSNVALTPSNAMVLVTSTFSADMSTEPTPIGRTLLYATPLSADFFGLLEMIPSQYSDSQYVSNHATDHLPKYMAGRCHFAASSSVASCVVFGQSRNRNSVVVYQYLWGGDERLQQAWHTWTFAYPISTAYFVGEAVHFVFVRNGVMLIAVVDPKLGVLTEEGDTRPFLDLYTPVTVTNRTFTIPARLLRFDPRIVPKMRMARAGSGLAGEQVGIESFNPTTNTGRTVRSFKNGNVWVGLPFRSTFSPTPPMVKDSQGRKIDSDKITVLRYGVNTAGSREYQVVATDAGGTALDRPQGTLRWCSTELDLGRSRVAGQSRAIIPVRVEADSSVLQLYTEGMGEMNIVGIDYVLKHHAKIRRFR